jgi:hypothetical protein
MRFSLLLVLTFMASCKPALKQNSEGTATNPLAETVEASLLSAGGVLDDSSNQSIQAQLSWSPISQAHAACSRTLTHQGNGVCVRNVNCDFGPYLWSGQVTLTYNNQSQCQLTGTGDYFTREAQFSRTGPRGTLQTSSQNRTTWDGQTIGGGTQVEQLDAQGNLSVSILGTHKILTRTSGGLVYDISVKTQSPLQTNKLARNGRLIQSGTIEVFHNRLQATATKQISNLQYESTCCYPVSGSITSTWSGQVTGSAQITFTGCGQFEILKDGVSSTHNMAACE